MNDASAGGLELLVAEQGARARTALAAFLRSKRHRVATAASCAEVWDQLDRSVFDVVIAGVNLPGANLPGAGALALLQKVRELALGTQVILTTDHVEVKEAVELLKAGASDYLVEPFDAEELAVRVQRLAERRRMEDELSRVRNKLAAASSASTIVGQSPAIAKVRWLIETMAQSDASVLIAGESGTGKELVARAIHAAGPRSQEPFVVVNCASFPETLLEAELFGHDAGAFTGAVHAREGRFEAARRGTLFLDEVAEIPMLAQAKLLRVVEDGVVEPLGSDRRIPIEVRIICATHLDMRERIEAGLFREDLFYRLNALELSIPPLRDRKSDLPLLIEHFLAAAAPPGAVPTLTPRARAALTAHSFPGNVRELQHAIERAMILARGSEIDLMHLPADIAAMASESDATSGEIRRLSVAVAEFERAYLLRALEQTHGRKAQAAAELGISRKNFWEKLRSHGL